MSEAAPQGIKRFYLVANLAILLSLAGAITALFLRTYHQASHTNAVELRAEILRSKREFIQNAVNRTIGEIEQARARCAAITEGHCDEGAVREELRERIRAIRLKDNGYLWVNAVVNYAGGDNYATRFVHPNLPETEGMMLSTNLRDIRGNTPYLTELEGVKRDGEIFFDYWFKKMDSEVIQHKMTFAKLYKPYDWIVATGVYLDDIDALVQTGTARWRIEFRQQLLSALAITVLAALLAWSLSLMVVRRVDTIYALFLDTASRQKEALRLHQETLEEQVRARTASLRASEAKYRRIVDTANEGIWVLDPELQGLFVNARMAEMLGYGVEEICGRPATEFLFGEDVAEYCRFMAARHADANAETREQRYRRKDGGTLWALVSVTPNCDEEQRPNGTFAMVTDITDRKQAERVVQSRLRLLEASSAAHLSLDDVLRLMLDEIEAGTGSAIGFYHFLGEDQRTLSLQSYSTNTLAAMCTAEGKGRHYPVEEAGVWADCVRERRPIIHNDYASLPHRHGMPRGHAPVLRELVVPVFRGQRIVAIIGVGNKPEAYTESDLQIAALLGDFSWEIVIRKQIEERLVKSEEQLRCTLEATRIGTWDWDLQNDSWTASPVYYTMLGYEPKEGPGDREEWMARIHPDDVALLSEKRDQVFLSNKFDDYQYEARLRHADGSYRWQLVKGFGIKRDAEGRVTRMLGIRMDIHDRKLAEEELRRHKEDLERRVAERTVELRKNNEELEHMNRLFIGRELRMIELKKRIKELERRQ